MKKIEDARKIYERLVTQFPNAGRYWKIYIEHEVNMSIHYFSKCKKTVCFLYVFPYLHTTWNGLVTQWYRIITACNGISFLKCCFVQFYYEITRAFTFEIIRISRVYIANTLHKIDPTISLSFFVFTQFEKGQCSLLFFVSCYYFLIITRTGF